MKKRPRFPIDFSAPSRWPLVLAACVTTVLLVAAGWLAWRAWQLHEQARSNTAAELQARQALAALRADLASKAVPPPAVNPEIQALDKFPWDPVLRTLESAANQGVRVRNLHISAPGAEVRVEVVYRDKGALLQYVESLNAGGGVPRWKVKEVQWAAATADAELTATLSVDWE